MTVDFQLFVKPSTMGTFSIFKRFNPFDDKFFRKRSLTAISLNVT